MLNWFNTEGDSSSPWDLPMGLAILVGFLVMELWCQALIY